MREQILEALKKIQAGERPMRDLGICANVYEIMCLEDSNEELEVDIHKFLESMFLRWPNFSGYVSYPVEGSSEVFWSAVAKRHRWDPEDDHGALRLDLLAWLIEELSK